MIDYNKIMDIEYECNNLDVSDLTFNSYMLDAKIANKSMIKKQFKILLPKWYDKLEKVNFTPYKYQMTKQHIIIPYDNIQHFFKYR